MIIVDYIQPIVHNNMSRWVIVAQRMKTITLTGRVPLVEQELLALQEHMISPRLLGVYCFFCNLL